MRKQYELLTDSVVEATFMSDDQSRPIRVTLSAQFLDRCGVDEKQKRQLHHMAFYTNDDKQFDVATDTTFTSPEHAPELADLVTDFFKSAKPTLKVVDGGKTND